MSAGYQLTTAVEEFQPESAPRSDIFVLAAPSGKRIVNTELYAASVPAGGPDPGRGWRRAGGAEIVQGGEAAAFDVQIDGPRSGWDPITYEYVTSPGEVQRYTMKLVCVDA